MSHIAKITLEINNLEILKLACERLGLEFMENQQTYKWYGTWIGDTPLPEGISIHDLGKCDHAIRVPGAQYEIGIVKRDRKYILLWDFWNQGGLELKLGKNAGRLKQAYTIERVRKEARLKGHRICEQKTDKGIRLVLRV
ncbi:MAG: DUF1257 domain-containing protein [Syntrophobacteraceae bacterium]|jgi:hypothetical protein